MVAVLSQRIHLWLLSVIGIVVLIAIASSEASSITHSLDKANVVNGSSEGLSTERKSEGSNDTTSYNATTLLARPEKTSFKCRGKPRRLCERDGSRYKVEKLKSKKSSALVRSKSEEKVAAQSHPSQIYSKKSDAMMHKSRNKSNSRFTNISNKDFLPVHYGPYGYQDEVSEARGWITVPLFIFFSIIQFKLVSAIFLAFFGPMVLFLLIVQGFLFKATLVLLGLMMS